MKSAVQTRIFISLTPEEARAAVNNAIDLQLCVRSALYQIDGTPIATLIAQNKKQLAAPRSAKNKRAQVHRATKPGRMVECPQCNKKLKAAGLGVHMARKHKPSPGEPGEIIMEAEKVQ